MINAKLTNAELIREIDNDFDQVKVTFEGGVQALLFDKIDNVIPLVGEDVLVDFRKDIVDGNKVDVCTSITQKLVISTLDKEVNRKLYSGLTNKTQSSVLFQDLNDNVAYDAIVLFVDRASLKSSDKTNWIEFVVLDRERNSNILRLFKPDKDVDPSMYNRKYVVCDVIKNKYGLTTNSIIIEPNLTIEVNQEYQLAYNYINQILKDLNNEKVRKVVEDNSLLNAIGTYINTESASETGSSLQRLAIELGLAQETRNLYRDLDYEYLVELIIIDKLHMLSNSNEGVKGEQLQNILALTKTSLLTKRNLFALTENDQKMVEVELVKKFKDISKLLTVSKYVTNTYPAKDKYAWSSL